MEQSIEFMKDLDRRFREASGLKDRRYYSIFYSRVQPSRVMVIGIKPGGRTDGSHQLASQSFYEDWSHEYVDMNYRIAEVMRPALIKALGAKSEDELRRVPKTNTFFQRAVGTDDFTSAELSRNAAMCAPFLAEILAYVRPQAIIMEGAGARDNVVRYQCSAVEEISQETVSGLRRGAENRFFRKERAMLLPVGQPVDLLTLGHPSQFGHLPAWNEAVAALQRNLGPSYLTPWQAGSIPPSRQPTDPIAPLQGARKVRVPRDAAFSAGRKFMAADQPPATFRFSHAEPKALPLNENVKNAAELQRVVQRAGGGPHYVYVLRWPEDMEARGAPFYVGIGQGTRLFSHEDEARDTSRTSAKLAVIRQIWDAGKEVLRTIDSVHVMDPWDREEQLINSIGRRADGTGSLTNAQVYSRSTKVGGVELRKYAADHQITGDVNAPPPKFKLRNVRLMAGPRKPLSSTSVFGKIYEAAEAHPGVTGEKLLELLRDVDFFANRSAYTQSGKVSASWLAGYIEGAYFRGDRQHLQDFKP